MNTYGMHTIHGRAAAIATGVKTANPELTVWQISGDGDGLAIGGNHFIHAVRRNVDINILIFNNKIYGLTKGQYSPTSDRGTVSKSSPYGTVEDPFIPAELLLRSARQLLRPQLRREPRTTRECMVAAARHKGHRSVGGAPELRHLQQRHPLILRRQGRTAPTTPSSSATARRCFFGKDGNRGLVQDGFGLKAVTVGEDGYTLDDVLRA